MMAQNKALAALQKGTVTLVPTTDGNGALQWVATGLNNVIGWPGVALGWFCWLIVHPQWHKLGPPCDRCKLYFVKRRNTQKRYCSRRCGNAATAVFATQAQRNEVRAEKLRRARRAAEKWIGIATRKDWKTWVHKRERDITPKFLTRAVNLGHLEAPVKKKS
jgi:hypothetical protein